MADTITPEEMYAFADDLLGCIADWIPRGQTMAAQNAKGILKPRIFNDSKDAGGKAIRYSRTRKTPRAGAYSRSHARARAKEGRQTSKVDFQFSDRLFNSIKVGKFGRDIGLGFTTATRSGEGITNAELADILEGMYGQDIFELGEKEVAKIEKIVFSDLAKFLNKTCDL